MMHKTLFIAVTAMLMTSATSADARGIRQRKPEIEVHLEVLEQFRGMAPQMPAQQQMQQQPVWDAPVAPPPAYNYAPLPPQNDSAFVPPPQSYEPPSQYNSGFVPPPAPANNAPDAKTRYAPAAQYEPYSSAAAQSSGQNYAPAQPSNMPGKAAGAPLPDSRYSTGRPLPPTPQSALAPLEPALPAFRAPEAPREPVIEKPKKAEAKKESTKETAKEPAKEKEPEAKPAATAKKDIDKEFDAIFKKNKSEAVAALPEKSAPAPTQPEVSSAADILKSVPDLPPAAAPAEKSPKQPATAAAPVIEPPSLDSILGDAPAANAVPPLPTLPEKSGATAKDAPPPPALPTSAGDNSKASASVYFSGADTSLSEDAKKKLQEIAAKLKSTDSRITLIAYASGTEDKASDSRRTSLSRAQSVRDFLKTAGIDANRIVPQAKGNQGGKESPDRVDLIF